MINLITDFALLFPKGFNALYTTTGLDQSLSRLPGDLLLPEGVRTTVSHFVGYLNYFIPHEVWFGFFTAVLILVVLRTIIAIIGEVWIG